MTNQHPITPPPELVEKWHQEYFDLYNGGDSITRSIYVATKAAQWGADQELEACVEWLDNQSLVYHRDLEHTFRAARRPKPPSLKEQALRDLDALAKDLERNGMGFGTAMIRRALEALDD